MSLNSLTADEAAILMGMLREVVRADGGYSAEEAAEMENIKVALGEERFEAAVATARTEFTSRGRLVDWVPKVTRPQAQDAILGALASIAAADGISKSEGDAIGWLSEAWGRRVRASTMGLGPDDASELGFIRRARALGDRWTRLHSRGGYRDGDSMRWDPSRLEVAIAPTSALEVGVRFRFEFDDQGPRLVVTIGEPGLAAPGANWTRLVRGLLKRLAADGRQCSARARALVHPIIGDELPRGARLESFGRTVFLELPLEVFPTPETLDGWIHGVSCALPVE